MAAGGSLHLPGCLALFSVTSCHTVLLHHTNSPSPSSFPALNDKGERGFLFGYKLSSFLLDSYALNNVGISYSRCDYILKASMDDDAIFSESRMPQEKNGKKNNENVRDRFERVLKKLGSNLVKQGRLSDFSDGEVTEESAFSDSAGSDSDSVRPNSDSNKGTLQKDGDGRGIEDENENRKGDNKDPEKLRDWQLRRLAYALKTGRRKTKIKKLCDDVCLERSIVIDILREPSVDLLLMSATLPDEPESMVPVDESSSKDIIRSVISSNTRKPKQVLKKVPVRRLPASKRGMKRNQILMLERLYRETRWPNVGTMNRMSNLIKLPQKKVFEWFEKKRSDKNDVHQPYSDPSQWNIK